VMAESVDYVRAERLTPNLVWLAQHLSTHGELEITPDLLQRNGIRIKDNVFVSQSSLFDWPDKEIDDLSEDGFCLGLRQHVAILADGTVVPCCLDSEGTINLGNVKETSFKSIIEGKRAMDLYRGFSERKAVEALCRKCGYRKRFDQ